MAARKPKVVVTRKLPQPVEARMSELFDVTLSSDDQPMGRKALAEALAEADVLVPTITDRLDAKALEAAGPQLRLIANFGAGMDNIDVAAANARGITVTNTPGVLTEDTADMAMALIMAVARRLVEAGVPIVHFNLGYWDWHGENFVAGRQQIPMFDAGLSSLLTDLSERGLLESTIVLALGLGALGGLIYAAADPGRPDLGAPTNGL